MFDHPKIATHQLACPILRPVQRDYFGKRHFERLPDKTQAITSKEGPIAHFRYRLYWHAGKGERKSDLYREWVAA